MRKTHEELNQLKEQLQTDRLWSWSRVHSYHTSMYEYYLNYIKHEPKDREESIYSAVGNMCHSIIEHLYDGKISYEDMKEEFDDVWTTAMLAELKFDRSDSEKNKSIGDKYYKNLKHFFDGGHKMFTTNFQLEQFVTIKCGDEYLMGYIDAVTKDDDGNYIVLDWKTSSIFSKSTLNEKSGQLCLYSLALNQMGIPLDKIKCGFDFLKYANVTVQMKNGKTKVRQIERCKLGESLQNNAKTWLKNDKYSDDEIVDYLDALVQTNSIECLPQSIQERYIIEDCIVYVDLTEELVQQWVDYVVDTTSEIRRKEKEYKETNDENLWWDDDDSVKAQSYYYSNLCSYSANKLKPYKAYLDKLEAEKNGGIFAVGSNETKKINEDDDLSWLNDL